MYRNGRYQFTIVLPPGEVADKVGGILENLGRSKAVYIVQAMSEYIDKHPELNCLQQAVPRLQKSLVQEKVDYEKTVSKKASSEKASSERKEPEPKQETNGMQALLQQMLLNNPDFQRQMSELLSGKSSKNEVYEDDDEVDDGDEMMLSAFRNMGDS